MGNRADEIRAYYANPYGQRPPSHHTRADSEQPVEVAGQPGLLTTALPRRTPISAGTFSRHHYTGGLIDLRVPLGSAWPVLVVTSRASAQMVAGRMGAALAGNQGIAYQTGNPAFDGQYQVHHAGAAPDLLARLLSPAVQAARCSRKRLRFLRLERVLWIEYQLLTYRGDSHAAVRAKDADQAGRWLLGFADTVMRAPGLRLGR